MRLTSKAISVLDVLNDREAWSNKDGPGRQKKRKSAQKTLSEKIVRGYDNATRPITRKLGKQTGRSNNWTGLSQAMQARGKVGWQLSVVEHKTTTGHTDGPTQANTAMYNFSIPYIH